MLRTWADTPGSRLLDPGSQIPANRNTGYSDSVEGGRRGDATVRRTASGETRLCISGPVNSEPQSLSEAFVWTGSCLSAALSLAEILQQKPLWLTFPAHFFRRSTCFFLCSSSPSPLAAAACLSFSFVLSGHNDKWKWLRISLWWLTDMFSKVEPVTR